MRLVVIESPFAGDTDRNLRYLRAAMRDCLLRGESPYASHALYTQPGVLDDTVPAEREHGIAAGFAWRHVAQATVVYADLGVTRGMQAGIDDATKRGAPVEWRTLTDWAPPVEMADDPGGLTCDGCGERIRDREMIRRWREDDLVAHEACHRQTPHVVFKVPA